MKKKTLDSIVNLKIGKKRENPILNISTAQKRVNITKEVTKSAKQVFRRYVLLRKAKRYDSTFEVHIMQ